jgi:hypothetical protein
MYSKKLLLIILCFLVFSCKKSDLAFAPYHSDGDVAKLYESREGVVNIIILGDGFLKEDLQVGGYYDQQVKKNIDHLFTVSPFNTYKNLFNIHVVYNESETRGAANSFDASNTKTKFNAYFTGLNSRSIVPGNYQMIYQTVEKVVSLNEAHLIILIVNDDRYAGTGGEVATITTNEYAPITLVHEVGHSFATLADEYEEPEIANSFPLVDIPFFANVDDTNDPAKVKWAHFLTKAPYKSYVSTFEGAYYRTNGVYRPEKTSLMRDATVGSFNAPSREAIVKRIFEIAQKPFDSNIFFAQDAANSKQAIVPPVLQQLPILRNDFINLPKRIETLKRQQKTQ